jgi:hypothetical protein
VSRWLAPSYAFGPARGELSGIACCAEGRVV